MPKAKIWTKSDPWLTHRLRNMAMVNRGDLAITNAVVTAQERFLTAAKHAIYRRAHPGLTADAGDASSTPGDLPEGTLPDLSAWPSIGSWRVMLDQVVTPEVTKLFGLAFAKATREADIQHRHYSQAYLSLVSNRLSQNLWPNVVFDQVRDVISEGLAKGWSITRITEQLSGVLSVDSQAWAARRIARTETMGAVNAGTWNGASAYGEITGEVQFKQWYATADSRTRPDHVKAHQQVVPMAEMFNVGGYRMSFPADPAGPPSEVCNCRCTLLTLSPAEAEQWLNPEDWDTSGMSGAAPESEASQPPLPFSESLVSAVTASTVSLDGPETTAPDIVLPDVQTAAQAGADPAPDAGSGDVGSWYGILAPLDTPSADGRMIAMPALATTDGDDNAEAGVPEPRTRPMPIPLLYQDSLSPGHDGAVPVGLITDAWVQDGNLMGCGTFDLDDPRAAAIARKVASGNLGWVSVDLDDTTMEYIEPEGAEHGDEDSMGMAVASDWRLMSATLVSQPAFPTAKIMSGRPEDAEPADSELEDDDLGSHGVRPPFPPNPHDGAAGPQKPKKPATAPSAVPSRPRSAIRTPGPKSPNPSAVGLALPDGDVFKVIPPDTSLPVAPADTAWDAAAAAKRVADWASDAEGKLDPGKYSKAFLYVQDGEDPTAVGSYKLGYADLIGGRLAIVPKAVYAVAGALGGARSPLKVPGPQKTALRSATERLYARLASGLGDDSIKAPWESAKSKAASRQAVRFGGAGEGEQEFAPPLAWFQNPSFPSYMNVTICDDGRIFGHLAPWGQCHTGRSDRCYTAPKSPSGYSYFHQGTVRTAEGLDVAVGTVHVGTDHANTRAAMADAQRHYADTGMASAVVRAGEDAFGIWIAGAVLPGADLVTLRRAAWSGDWRRIGPAMELCGVLSVNQPGFPVPRPAWKTDDRGVVLALTAAAGTACARADVPGAHTVMEQFTTNLAAGLAAEMRHVMAAEKARERRFERARASVEQVASKVRAERFARAMSQIKNGG